MIAMPDPAASSLSSKLDSKVAQAMDDWHNMNAYHESGRRTRFYSTLFCASSETRSTQSGDD